MLLYVLTHWIPKTTPWWGTTNWAWEMELLLRSWSKLVQPLSWAAEVWRVVPAPCPSCLVSHPTLCCCWIRLLCYALWKPCEGSTHDFPFPCILVLSTIPEQTKYWVSICWPVCGLACMFSALVGTALGEEGSSPGRVRPRGCCLVGDVSRRFGLGNRTILTTILVLSITLLSFSEQKCNSLRYLLKRNFILG